MSGIEVVIIGGLIYYGVHKHHQHKRAKRAALDAAVADGSLIVDINGNSTRPHDAPAEAAKDEKPLIGEDGLPMYTAVASEPRPPRSTNTYTTSGGVVRHGVPQLIEPEAETGGRRIRHSTIRTGERAPEEADLLLPSYSATTPSATSPAASRSTTPTPSVEQEPEKKHKKSLISRIRREPKVPAPVTQAMPMPAPEVAATAN